MEHTSQSGSRGRLDSAEQIAAEAQPAKGGTKQDKTGFAINETKSPADSHFNRWRVDPVPLNQMIVVDEAKMHSLFPSDVVGASEFERCPREL